jgi:metallo-beta-lactamase class B
MTSRPAQRRLALWALLSGIVISAQTPPARAALAKDPNLFISVATKAMHWEEPAEPFRVAGPIYFVGTKGPHVDHCGGNAYIEELSGAKVAMMDSEVELLQSGGKTDFHYGQNEKFWFGPVKVDRVLHDGDTVTLGEVTLTAHRTPGHTRGATTYTTTVTDGGQSYFVVFPDGSSVNPGYRISKDPSYPGIRSDYLHTFQVHEGLKPAIWLSPHTEEFAFESKHARSASEGIRAWVDPEGYRQWVAGKRKAFEAAIAEEAKN